MGVGVSADYMATAVAVVSSVMLVVICFLSVLAFLKAHPLVTAPLTNIHSDTESLNNAERRKRRLQVDKTIEC